MFQRVCAKDRNSIITLSCSFPALGTCPGHVLQTPLRQTHSGQLPETPDMTSTISKETVRSKHAVITALTRARQDTQWHICVMADEDLKPLSPTLVCHNAPPPDFSLPIRFIHEEALNLVALWVNYQIKTCIHFFVFFFSFFVVLADTRKTLCFNASH